MPLFRSIPVTGLLAVSLLLPRLPAQSGTPSVGSDAPSELVKSLFIAAYNRRGFSGLVAPTPATHVQKLGPTGVAQLFFDGGKTAGVRLAIVMANSSAPPVVDPVDGSVEGEAYQILAPMWSYTASVNATSVTSPAALGTTGYPVMDTSQCLSINGIPCSYQLFDKNYALFVYGSSLPDTGAQNIAVRNSFYTRWASLGGLGLLGAATSAEQAVASRVSSLTATAQQFHQGAIVEMSSGVSNGRIFVIKGPIYNFFLAQFGFQGFLGLPVGDELLMTDGRIRQSFEGGTVEYAPGSAPVLLLPLLTVRIAADSPVRMRVGESVEVTASLTASDGSVVTDRAVAWTVSNGRVLSVESNGTKAKLRALSNGTAQVSAVSEGRVSPALTVLVNSPCCQPGEGAPTAALRQAFQDALARNKLRVKLPTPSVVRREGPGYVQEFEDAAAPVSYLVAVPSSRGVGFVVTGEILARYLSLSGPSGSLGYPQSDATPGGRQMFESQAALAGTPPVVVQGPVLTKWASLGFESGPAGLPVGTTEGYATFTGSLGVSQQFGLGRIFATNSGLSAGRSSIVRSPFLERYLGSGGPAGMLGAPVGDEVAIDGGRRQDFEGGWMSLEAGEEQPRVEEKPRKPAISATPDPVSAGTRVRLAVGGFADGSRLRVHVDGQTDFVILVPNGWYAWELAVPPSATGALVKVTATSGDGTRAEASYRVRSQKEADPQLTKAAGDAQTGYPGGLLPERLRVQLKDGAGQPMSGIAVRFEASPGAALASADAVTGAGGEAEVALRLPVSDGVALVTATAAGKVVTFSARSAASSLADFPQITQNVSGVVGDGPAALAEKGSMIAAVAGMVRQFQNRGDAPTPNGFADVIGLNAWLKTYCAAGVNGATVCDGFLRSGFGGDWFVNLWRVPQFVGNALAVEIAPANTDPVRDWLGQGTPVLFALDLQADGAPAGAHFVVGVGVSPTGAILIQDASTAFRRTTLNEFLTGFQMNGTNWKATIRATIRFVAESRSHAGFLLSGQGQGTLSAAGEPCAASLTWNASLADGRPSTGESFTATWCSGGAESYQLESSGTAHWVLTDLGTPGSQQWIDANGPSVFEVKREPLWMAAPPAPTVIRAVNAANSDAGIAPGTLISILGSALASGAELPQVTVGGLECRVISGGPFRVNAEIPLTVPPGIHTLAVSSPLGSVESPVSLDPLAPAIFQTTTGYGVIRNADGTANSAQSPARRGTAISISVNGLGVIDGGRPLVMPSVIMQGRSLAVDKVDADLQLPGVYTLRIGIPIDLAPGFGQELRLEQGGLISPPVLVAIQ